MSSTPPEEEVQKPDDRNSQQKAQALLAAIAASGRGDFPAISKFLYEVRAALRKENASIHSIASLILNDFAITNSILRLVNSAFYGTDNSRRISTISRAVGFVGVDAIANLAIALNVFESFNGLADVAQLKKLTVHSLLTGVHARELLRGDEAVDMEVTFIAGMMSNLGRLVVSFYLPDLQTKIEQLAVSRGISLDEACVEVMGMPFVEIGQTVGRSWSFPDEIIEAIGGIDPAQGSEKPTMAQKLRAAVSCANELSTATSISEPQKHHETLNLLREKYKTFFPLEEEAFNKILKTSSSRLGDLTKVLRITGQDLQIHAPALMQRGTAYRPISFKGSGTCQASGSGAFKAMSQDSPESSFGSASSSSVGASPFGRPFATGDAPSLSSALMNAVEPETPQLNEILANALDEISSAMANEAPLNDVLLMILEGIYRGIGYDHVLLALVSPDRAWLRGRYCLGPRWEDMTTGFTISLRPPLSRLAAAIAESREILIPDTQAAPDIGEALLSLLQAKSFLLLPIVVKNISLGAIYAQRVTGQGTITETEQRNTRMLRNHAAMAIRHCQQG